MFFGNSGLQSLGVSAKNPPDMSIHDHRPTVNDYEMYREKHLWFVDLATTPLTYEIWFLANKFNYQSLWLQIYPAPGSGGGGILQTEDLLQETPDPTSLAINIYGAVATGNPIKNITTYQVDAYTVGVSLNNSIWQPNTNNTATEGMYSLGGLNFMPTYGD